MKARGSSRGIAPLILKFGTRWMWMWPHAPAALLRYRLSARLVGPKAGLEFRQSRPYQYLKPGPSNPQPGSSATSLQRLTCVWRVVVPSDNVCWQLSSSQRFRSRNFKVTGHVRSSELVSPPSPPSPQVIYQMSSVTWTFWQCQWSIHIGNVTSFNVTYETRNKTA